METINRVNMNEDMHFEFSCTYGSGHPEHGFEFVIYNKKNNVPRAKVMLNKTQMLGLIKSLDDCLNGKKTE